MQREVKVGLLVVAAFVILGVAVFLVSERRNFFALKNRYYIQFETVLGLAPGSPAQLNGVTVGSIRESSPARKRRRAATDRMDQRRPALRRTGA